MKQRDLLLGVPEYIQNRKKGISEVSKLFRGMGNKKLDSNNKVTCIERRKNKA